MLKKIVFIFCVSIAFFFVRSSVSAQGRIFTAQELAQYDGRDGHPAYYAYEGKVYDVTSSKLWKLGEHFGVYAGEDLTGKMENAPHGTEVFASFPIVGEYVSEPVMAREEATVSPAADSVAPVAESTAMADNQPAPKQWYEGRIRILGISILGWTGIIMGVFFVFTFATCFAMPWAKFPLPWKGSRPGPDALDAAPKHMIWSSVHKHFVWWVVIFGVIHGVLGILQLFGLYL